MPARLVALDRAPDIALAGLLTVVGRHRDCDACLDSARVSRRHCCLALGGDAVLVRDLGSTNGTRITGRKVHEGELRPGDVLAIAHLRFRLTWRGEDGPAAPGPAPAPEPALTHGTGTTYPDLAAPPSPPPGPGRGPMYGPPDPA